MLQIPLESLSPAVRELDIEKIILILNSTPIIKTEIVSRGVQAEKMLALNIRGFEVNHHGKPHMGDILIWKRDYPEIKIMVEVKNYKGNVSSEQYEKFCRDLDQHRFAAGLLVSNRPIANIPAGFSLFDNHAVVVTTDNDFINVVCEMLWCRAAGQLQNSKLDIISFSKECGELLENIEVLATLKTTVTNLQKATVRHCGKLLEDIDGIMYRSQKIVRRINKYAKFGEKKEITTFELPTGDKYFYQKYPEVAAAVGDIIAAFISTNVGVTVAEYKGRYEFAAVGGRLLVVKYFVGKMSIGVVPTTLDFCGLEDISYADGLLYFTITRANKNSNIYGDILKFVK